MKRRKDNNTLPAATRRKRSRQSRFWCNDPLNLKEITVQASTPKSSPLPTPKYKQEVEILIPANMRDPLNLTGQTVSGSNNELASPLKVHKGRTRRKKKKKTTAEAEDLKSSVDKVNLVVEKKDDRVGLNPVTSQTESKEPKDSSWNTRSNRSQRPNAPNVRKSNRKRVFRYGNFDRYYGYRNAGTDDPRLSHFESEWFEGRDILDIGCNNGHFSLAIFQKFQPRSLKGIDIDIKLIGCARQSLTNILADDSRTKESSASSSVVSTTASSVTFVAENYVLASDEDLSRETQQFDTVLCLSVTKWVHLNWGDEGLKRLFKRVYRQLRPGGIFILEPQPWESYSKNKRHKISDEFNKNFKSIQLFPIDFPEYLMSTDVGFASCDLIDIPDHKSNGFKRPLYKLVKPTCTTMSIESA